MSKVALVTDSTANIPEELANGLALFTVPLQVIWGQQTYLDGIDIQPAEFYSRLPTTKVTPTTSQPTPAAFTKLYRQLLDEGYDILSVHISSKLSGTLDSATQAKENFPGDRITLVDSDTTAMAMGFPILLAARAAKQGATLKECKTLVEQGCKQSGVYFAVSTLEFLRRGGRIGGAAAFLGTALGLKPVLELKDGHVDAIERVRTMSKALNRLLDLFVEQVGDRRPVRVSCLHANAPQEAELLLERARQRFAPENVSEAVLSPISPVLGTHTGPGCLGIAFMAGM